MSTSTRPRLRSTTSIGCLVIGERSGLVGLQGSVRIRLQPVPRHVGSSQPEEAGRIPVFDQLYYGVEIAQQRVDSIEVRGRRLNNPFGGEDPVGLLMHWSLLSPVR